MGPDYIERADFGPEYGSGSGTRPLCPGPGQRLGNIHLHMCMYMSRLGPLGAGGRLPLAHGARPEGRGAEHCMRL